MQLQICGVSMLRGGGAHMAVDNPHAVCRGHTIFRLMILDSRGGVMGDERQWNGMVDVLELCDMQNVCEIAK